MKNSTIYSSNLALNVIREILFFPIWWYSIGLLSFALSLKNFIINREKELALSIWVKNIFVPMYGQRDFQGIIISIIIRFFQIIARSIIMLFWILTSIIFFIFWLIIPVFLIYQIIWQLFL